jgi:hypothetical protein
MSMDCRDQNSTMLLLNLNLALLPVARLQSSKRAVIYAPQTLYVCLRRLLKKNNWNIFFLQLNHFDAFFIKPIAKLQLHLKVVIAFQNLKVTQLFKLALVRLKGGFIASIKIYWGFSVVFSFICDCFDIFGI